jgi:mannosylglycerate hydrolase
VRVAFELPPLGGLALARLAPASGSGSRVRGDVVATGRRIANGVMDVDLSRDGTLSIHDRRSGARFTRLLGLESEADAGDTYSFAPGTAGVTKARARVTSRLLAAGPLSGILVAEWDALDASFQLRIELRSGEPFVRLSLEILNRGIDRRIRARFPTGAAGASVFAGAAFGGEQREASAPKRDSPAERPVPTAPAHRYVAVSSGPGLALLVPGHCEYEGQADGTLLLTLLRSVGQLSRSDLPTRPGHAGWPTATPGAQCLGPDRMTLALAPLAEGDAAPDRLHDLWERAFLPIAGRWFRDANALHVAGSAIELTGEGLVLSAVKPAEDGHGIVLRCWNATEQTVAGSWRVVPAPAQAWIARADEANGDAISVDAAGTVAFTAGPRAIVTVRIA